MNPRFWLMAGGILAGLSVSAGALGTHYLKETLELPAAQLETFETAVRYQAFHALALILVGLLGERAGTRLLTVAGGMFLVGTLLFSGGIYAYLASGSRPFIHVVPVGGLLWIVGWLLFVLAMFDRPAAAAGGDA